MFVTTTTKHKSVRFVNTDTLHHVSTDILLLLYGIRRDLLDSPLTKLVTTAKVTGNTYATGLFDTKLKFFELSEQIFFPRSAMREYRLCYSLVSQIVLISKSKDYEYYY